MSPLTLSKIKNANGNVKIVAENGSYCVKVLDNGAWVTIYTNNDRSICEQAVRKASSKLILG